MHYTRGRGKGKGEGVSTGEFSREPGNENNIQFTQKGLERDFPSPDLMLRPGNINGFTVRKAQAATRLEA